MTLTYRLIQFFLVLFFAVLISTSAWSFASDWQQVDYPTTAQQNSVRIDDLAFNVRAPPLTVDNVTIAGVQFMETGEVRALYGMEVIGAVSAFSRSSIATNNTATIGGKTCVYSCVVDGTTRYVGITDDVARRGAEHLSQKGIKISGIRGLDNLSRADAHAVEQTLINYYGLGKDGGTLLNKINSISPTRNPTAYEQSLLRGKELLDSVDYQWTN